VTDRREQLAPVIAGIGSGELRWAMRLTNGSLAPRDPIPEDERIAGFARLWSEVKYNFVFFDRVPDLDWDRVLADYLPRIRAAETAPAYYRVLRECMALLHDGHSDVVGPSDEPTATLPIRLADVEGKAIVVSVRSPDTVRDDRKRRELEAASLARGDEVTAIDGESVRDILEQQIHPYLSASTPQHLALKAYPLLGNGEPGTVARLAVRSLQGTEREVTLTRGYLTAAPLPMSRPDFDLGDGIVYVAIDSFGSASAAERFEAELPRIRGARGLILDLRRNGGGSTSHANRVLGWLTDKPLPGSKWKTRLYRPAFRAWGQPEQWHEGRHDGVRPAANPFLGPVVVLTSARTFSAAEDFLVVLEAAGRATLVGERTGGSTGQPLAIGGLPAGGSARVCAKRDTFPDGTEFVGIGVIPDVEVRPTVRDVAAGRDVVFERGLAEVKRLAAR
jgi:C-terminal processing protease CtpA/Prc